MIEIRFHGRGGQGAQVACKLLADAAFREGKDVQSFPYFGVERRGAPVTAFTKIDSKPIRVKSQIYEPDYVIVLDASLLAAVDVTAGLKPDGIVLVNTVKPPEEVAESVAGKICTVDATGIAIANKLGSKAQPIVNTSILGAFAKASGIVKIESVITAITEGLNRYPDRNAEAARQAYEQTEGGA